MDAAPYQVTAAESLPSIYSWKGKEPEANLSQALSVSGHFEGQGVEGTHT
jgi:hypothetical protein